MLAVRLTDIGDHPESAALLRTMIHRIAGVMIEQVLEAEVEAYLLRHRDARDRDGHALVVRNGKSRRRKLTTSLGKIVIRAPRVHDRRTDADGRREKFISRVLPAYARAGPKTVELLPPLYLSGLATGDFSRVAVAIAGTDESGSLWSTLGSLTTSWEADYRMWREHRLDDSGYTYLWVGDMASAPAGDGQASLLLAIGTRSSGAIELVGVRHGLAADPADWTPLLDDARRRGMAPPIVAVGHESLGFWAAAAAVWPTTEQPRIFSERVVIAPGLTTARYMRAQGGGDL
jgi:putative transposase